MLRIDHGTAPSSRPEVARLGAVGEGCEGGAALEPRGDCSSQAAARWPEIRRAQPRFAEIQAALLKLRRGGEALACCEAALREAETETEAAEKKAAAEKEAEGKEAEGKEAAGVGCAVLSKVQYRKALAERPPRDIAERHSRET